MGGGEGREEVNADQETEDVVSYKTAPGAAGGGGGGR